MPNRNFQLLLIVSSAAFVSFAITGCGAGPVGTNVNLANSGANRSNSTTANANAANTNTAAAATNIEAKEPGQYQATVTIKLEAVGGNQAAALPTLSALVARNADDRRMEFSMPAGGRVIFLDKAGSNYLVLPDKKQYAELNREALGMDVRRMLMPEQIVQQVKGMRGMELVGEEQYNGRSAIKYRYGAVADTKSQAGQVATESFLIVDKETGLPLRSETLSQSQSGGNVQGFSGVRVITEITEIKTDPSPTLFDPPTDLQKIEASQVRSQVDMIFSTLASFVTRMMQQNQGSSANTSATPAG